MTHVDPGAVEPKLNRSISRKGAKAQRKNELSFRTKREIFPRSLAFARDDRPWACHLASLRLGGRNFRLRVLSASRSFAHAAQILNYSSIEVAEFGVFFNQQSLLRALSASAVSSLLDRHSQSYRLLLSSDTSKPSSPRITPSHTLAIKPISNVSAVSPWA